MIIRHYCKRKRTASAKPMRWLFNQIILFLINDQRYPGKSATRLFRLLQKNQSRRIAGIQFDSGDQTFVIANDTYMI